MRTTIHNLPDHAALEAAEVAPFIESLLTSHEKEIETIVQSVGDLPTWDNLMMPIEALDVELNDAWAPVSHMNSVVSNDALRKAHDESVQQISEFETRKSQYKPLYEAISTLAEHRSFGELTPPQQKMVNDALRQFRRNGVALDESERAEFRELSLKLTRLSTEFANHLLDATDAWFLHVTNEDELQGIPAANLAVAEAAAKGKDLSGFVLTLDMASYSSTMMHCDNRAIRAEMYEAYATRASDVGPQAGIYDNSGIVKEILITRTKLANLVDFENYAEYSIDPKMASSASEVHDFLRDLLAKAAPQAQSELERMQEFAELELGYDQLEPWDLSFVAEKMRKSLFDVADDQLKPYFPLDQVVSGMFSLVEDLFNVTITKLDAPASWHPDVRYYEIARGEEVIARFYLDAFAREKKRSGAWMADCRSRRRVDNISADPVAYLTCNFTPPAAGLPSLLTHSEVVTLFHEFGHGLHHMLTQQSFATLAGINGVEWDAVELPSQFMENWCWQTESLAQVASHHETGEKLPQELLDKLIAAKNFNSGLGMVRQLEFGLLDLTLHMQTEDFDPLATMRKIRSDTKMLPLKNYDRFPLGFAHIFAGGYAAGYYSYLWAEVLSADAFAAFEEEGLDNRNTSFRFLNEILEVGSSITAQEMFQNFRGRAPDNTALLRHTGIAG